MDQKCIKNVTKMIFNWIEVDLKIDLEMDRKLIKMDRKLIKM